MSQPGDYTVGWICAVTTEYIAAQAFLDEKHNGIDFLPDGDNNDYTLGRIGRHNIVIAVIPYGEYGMSRAATVATDIIRTFPNIRIGLMVGIGGGAPSPRHDIRLGDIVVNAPREGKASVLQYDFGKTIQDRKFQRTGFMNQSPLVLRSAVSGLMAEYEMEGHRLKEDVDEALKRYPRLQRKYGRPDQISDRLYKSSIIHPYTRDSDCDTDCGFDISRLVFRPERTGDDDDPMIHYGIIASGNQLMKDASIRDDIAQEEDILCFEMEAAGLMNHFPCLVIRGICDYADSHKNDIWQGYAAMMAASYARNILYRIAPNNVEAQKQISATLSEITNAVEVHRHIAQEQLQILREHVDQRLSQEEWQCHQLFRLASGSYNATYEWYKDRVENRLENTCMWLLNSPVFQEWMTQDSGPLLVSADPGCGKSVLAKYLIDHGLPRSSAICYFFFKDQDQNTTRQALCALLHQLFCQKPSLLIHALPRYRQEGRALIESSISLWKILRQATHDYDAGPVIIVLDALDECAESEFRGLIQNIVDQSYHNGSSHKVKYLLTCRPYIQILSDFEELIDAFPSIHIPGEEQSDVISQEVDHVVRYRLDQLAIKKHLSPDIRQSLEKRLHETTHRTYLWVSLTFDYLMRESFKKTVKGVESATMTLPKSVNEAYEGILSKAGNSSVVRRVLCVLLAAQRPLTVSEMNVAINIDYGLQSLDELDIETDEDFKVSLRSWCGLFVSIYQDRIYFLHQTAREFLLANLNSDAPISPQLHWHRSISSQDAHVVLTELCVLYLDLADFESNSSANTTMQADKSVNKRAFLYYSAQNWSVHLHQSCLDYESKIMPSALRISNPNSSSHAVWFDIFWQTTGFQKTNLCTDLMVASFLGLSSIVQSLLDKGTDIEARDTHFSMTPLMWAVIKGHEPIVKLLLDYGADSAVRVVHGQTPLLQAAEQGNKGIAKLLLEGGADIDIRDEEGLTPLQVAVENRHEEIVNLLLDKGANMDVLDKEGNTLLLFAWRKSDVGNYKNILHLLRKRGADSKQFDETMQRQNLQHAERMKKFRKEDHFRRRGF
ncbi:ankyrin repeat-containing protein [Fusarium circinatum]|uniref:Ankyrin repeat-containing protein n=1 Tax=Fusarium circinatum TaxID=48490 RepID=A0A8H5XA79_FUSCI|nr:ankyrin repeat-containing protein [Fusarium circinatum]